MTEPVAVILYAEGEQLFIARGGTVVGDMTRNDEALEAFALGGQWCGTAPSALIKGKPSWVLLHPRD